MQVARPASTTMINAGNREVVQALVTVMPARRENAVDPFAIPPRTDVLENALSVMTRYFVRARVHRRHVALLHTMSVIPVAEI